MFSTHSKWALVGGRSLATTKPAMALPASLAPYLRGATAPASTPDDLLRAAALAGDVDAIRRALDDGARPRAFDSNGWSAHAIAHFVGNAAAQEALGATAAAR